MASSPDAINGSNGPLKRRLPSPIYSLPQNSADAVAGFHLLVSEGYQFHHLPCANSDLKDSFVLNCAGCMTITLERADSANKIHQEMDKIKDSEAINCPIPTETETPPEKTINTKEALPQEEAVDDDLEAEADLVKPKKVGEYTMLEVKCKCGTGYSIGRIGNTFFYKLL